MVLKSIQRRHLGKSIAHEEIQCHLKKQIPELELEKRLGARRADAFWEKEKIVFEVQLSPISLELAARRCQDYSGYQVVWILHEGEFNQRRVSPAEKFLRTSYPTYFTNGRSIYDQIEVLEGQVRKYRSDPLPIQINAPRHPFLKVSDRSWQLHFAGDLHSWCATHGLEALDQVLRSYRSPQGLRFWLQFAWIRILELCCKNPK